MQLKLTKIGNSVGVVLPKEMRDRMRLDSGDVLYLTETEDGYRLTPYDPEFARQMEASRAVMRKRRDALRELAK